MKQVEQHIIKPNHSFYSYCHQVTTISCKLFNTVQFNLRQGFFYGYDIPKHAQLDKLFSRDSNYRALPAKVSQLVLKQATDLWKAYKLALVAYGKDSRKFTGKPKPPGYVTKRNLVKFNNQAIGKREFKKGFIVPSCSELRIPVKPGLKFSDLCEVRIVTKVGCFVIEIVYELPDSQPERDRSNQELAAAIDLGLDALMTVTFNDPNIQPIIINGKILKSINQFYNKQVAKYKSRLSLGVKTSKRLENIIRNRNNRLKTHIHQVTRRLTNELISLGVSDIAIGKNEQWKTNIKIGKRNNQNFVQIPHAKIIDQLTEKLKSVGIDVIVGEESYTSKASFLDWDKIP
ncbi:MAG: RNA-guided endonuclease InsQ/TnpB family protein, partial [Xenococcaceae cyanobacterium]